MMSRWAVSLTFAIAFASGLFGSPQTRLAAQRQLSNPADRQLVFEVAVLKPNVNSGVGVSGGCRGNDSHIAADDPRVSVPLGRCVINAGALRHLMAMAFSLPLNRITGFPEWDGDNRFDIQAKADDPATTSEHELLSMLQQFLIDEFTLKVHRQQKDGPTFSLVVAKNGPKNLHQSSDTGCRMSPAMTHGLAFNGCSMHDFASFLSTVPTVQRPVNDGTALSGHFDFSLEVGSKTQDVAAFKAAMSVWESLFSDVQEQLGLRLERSTGSVETLVIDHAELPHVR